jgi:hypothetical protein
MTPFVAAGAGFLLSVLWFDLMFDVQVVRHRGGELPDEVLSSIAGYYARVTTGARPMNRLVAAVMLGTLVAIVVQLTGDDAPDWVAWSSLALVVSAVALAALHTVPAGVRLGRRADAPGVQAGLARSIFRDHLLCLSAIVATLTLQLAFG